MSKTIRIPAHQVSPPLRALFDMGQPVAIRCFAVLDGSIRGQIWTDDLAQPTWGAVQEAAFGTLFLGGQPNAGLVSELVAELRQEQGVALALWPDHPYNQILPPLPISRDGNWNLPIVPWEQTHSLISPCPRTVNCGPSIPPGLRAVGTATITRRISGVRSARWRRVSASVW